MSCSRSLLSGTQQLCGERSHRPGKVMCQRAMLPGYQCRVLLRGSMEDKLLPSGHDAACRGSLQEILAWGRGLDELTSQVPKSYKPILGHSSAPRHCQASLWSFPRCLGNERPTHVIHSKVQEPERTMPDCSKLSSVSLEAFYGPSLGKHEPH